MKRRVTAATASFPVETTPEQEGDVYVEGANGLEFQIVDDAGDEAKNPKRRSGAIYGLVAPSNPPPVGPGVSRRGRIVVNGDKIEDYLNGVRVVDITVGPLGRHQESSSSRAPAC